MCNIDMVIECFITDYLKEDIMILMILILILFMRS
jgi:hypothetical protein